MDTGFHHQQSTGMNQQAITFQSSPRNEQSEMIMIGDLHRVKRTGSMSFSGSSGGSSSYTGIGNSCESHVVESVPVVPETKHRAGLDGDWSVAEQYKLEQALVKYADESGMIKYVKIASTLRNKTVRDVAIRCRWMATKRRKHEERSLWKRSKDTKDKWVESSSMPNVSSVSTLNVAPLSFSMNHRVRGDGVHLEALQSSMRHLLEQNNRVLGQISTNIHTLKLQDNFDLFRQTKNNITAILNDMRCMPGPPVPVSLNEDLANAILSIKTQTMMFSSSGGMNMKQEPGYW
ncbi:putative transcription factor MYB-HB-like family [Helianthus anomalus]